MEIVYKLWFSLFVMAILSFYFWDKEWYYKFLLIPFIFLTPIICLLIILCVIWS